MGGTSGPDAMVVVRIRDVGVDGWVDGNPCVAAIRVMKTAYRWRLDVTLGRWCDGVHPVSRGLRLGADLPHEGRPWWIADGSCSHGPLGGVLVAAMECAVPGLVGRARPVLALPPVFGVEGGEDRLLLSVGHGPGQTNVRLRARRCGLLGGACVPDAGTWRGEDASVPGIQVCPDPEEDGIPVWSIR